MSGVFCSVGAGRLNVQYFDTVLCLYLAKPTLPTDHRLKDHAVIPTVFRLILELAADLPVSKAMARLLMNVVD
jgi:hypothetical protein